VLLDARCRRQVRAAVAAARRTSPRAMDGGRTAVVQWGGPASSVYVRNKRSSSQEAGIESFAHDCR